VRERCEPSGDYLPHITIVATLTLVLDGCGVVAEPNAVLLTEDALETREHMVGHRYPYDRVAHHLRLGNGGGDVSGEVSAWKRQTEILVHHHLCLGKLVSEFRVHLRHRSMM